MFRPVLLASALLALSLDPALAQQPTQAQRDAIRAACRSDFMTNCASVTPGGAQITSPFGVAFDDRGTLYFVEMLGHRVRKIGRDGLVTTLAGTGREGNGGDAGLAIRAEFNGPHSLAVTTSGDIYVADTWNNRVRKIDGRSGVITVVAGTGRKGFSGDGGPATEADFGGIYCIALDEGGHQ